MAIVLLLITILLFSTIIIFSSNGFEGDNKQELNVNKKNVILIILESTRKDHLTCYGYHRNTTPHICDIADDGVLFENAYSQGTCTYVSIPPLLTSMLPNVVSLNNWNEFLKKEIKPLARVLNKSDYKTFANEIYGFPSLIQVVENRFETAKNLVENLENNDLEGAIYYRFFFRKLAHIPYKPSKEFRKWGNETYEKGETENWRKYILLRGGNSTQKMIDLYDSELLMADNLTGRIIERLREGDEYRESLIILTSDHGEYLGEHGQMVAHEGKPYEELIHIPLIIKFPGNRWKGRRVKQQVRHIDVLPTIYDILNVNTETYGKSLVPTIKGKKLNITIFSAGKPRRNWTVKKGDMKYILENPESYCNNISDVKNEELYNLSKDPEERNNLVGSSNVNISTFRNNLCKIYLRGLGRNLTLDRSELIKDTERLKDLGYTK